MDPDVISAMRQVANQAMSTLTSKSEYAVIFDLAPLKSTLEDILGSDDLFLKLHIRSMDLISICQKYPLDGSAEVKVFADSAIRLKELELRTELIMITRYDAEIDVPVPSLLSFSRPDDAEILQALRSEVANTIAEIRTGSTLPPPYVYNPTGL